MPSLKLNEIFQRRNTRDDKHGSIGRSFHGRKSSLTLSAFNFSLTIEKDDKNSSASSRPLSTAESAQHGPVWWQYRKSVVENAHSDEEDMDQLLKARKMGSAVARRKKALERETAATTSVEDLVARTRRELGGGYRSEEEELSDSEDYTYSPVIGEDEADSILSTSTDDAVSIRQARFSTSIKAKAVPLLTGRSLDRRPSGLRLTIDSDESTTLPPAVEEEASAPPSPSILDPSDVSEAGDYFSIRRDDDLTSPSIPAGTPLETATPILYVSPITRPNLISIHSRTPPILKRIDIPPRSAARPVSTTTASSPTSAETNLRSPQTAINMILQTVPPSSPLAASGNADEHSVGVPSVVPHNPTRFAPTAPSLDSSTGTNLYSSSASNHGSLSRSSSFRRLAGKASKASLRRQKSKPELPHQHYQADQRDAAPALPDTFSDTTTTASSTSLSRTASVATTVSSKTTNSTPYSLFPSFSASPDPQPLGNNFSTTNLPSQPPQPLASKKSFASLRSLTYTISPVISGNLQNSAAVNSKPRGRFPVVPRVDTSARVPEVALPSASSSSVAATPESAYGIPMTTQHPAGEEDQQRLLGSNGAQTQPKGLGLGLDLRSGLGKEKGYGGGSASMGLRRVMGQVSRSR
ncbi:MAG: hypothetical protein Q9160_005931 [Pyrenula sp. 1 TL-2023]